MVQTKRIYYLTVLKVAGLRSVCPLDLLFLRISFMILLLVVVCYSPQQGSLALRCTPISAITLIGIFPKSVTSCSDFNKDTNHV